MTSKSKADRAFTGRDAAAGLLAKEGVVTKGVQVLRLGQVASGCKIASTKQKQALCRLMEAGMRAMRIGRRGWLSSVVASRA